MINRDIISEVTRNSLIITIILSMCVLFAAQDQVEKQTTSQMILLAILFTDMELIIQDIKLKIKINSLPDTTVQIKNYSLKFYNLLLRLTISKVIHHKRISID
jgi:hypothetical protein